MRMFYFTSREYAIKNIENQRLKIATIDKMNDPFEFYINFNRSEKMLDESEIEAVKKNYIPIMGFLCFSTKIGDPVQWAHYSDNHKGICMEFEIPKKLLIKIDYRKDPISVDIDKSGWDEKFSDATTSKYQHWSYEREYRIAVNLQSPEVVVESDLYFKKFSDDLELKNICKGVNCKLTDSDLAIIKKADIPLTAARLDRSSYSILTD